MGEWKSINVYKQFIKAESAKSVLIACPKKTEFSGYSFWHPKKLVREGRNRSAVSISYTDKFVFTLRKYSKSDKNKILDEEYLTADEFEKLFEVVDNNILYSKKRRFYYEQKDND